MHKLPHLLFLIVLCLFDCYQISPVCLLFSSCFFVILWIYWDRREQDWDGLEMLLLRILRLPICFRRLRIILSTCVPVCWLVGLLYCLVGILVNQNQLDIPRLRLEGIYEIPDNGMLLPLLGFVPDPVLYPRSHHTGQDLPVFVMTLSSNNLHSFHRFLGNFRIYFSQKKLVVYDLGLTKDEMELVC